MKYLILSDIHENFHNLSIAIQYGRDKKITHGLVLGDLVNPGIMHQLGRSNLNFTVILGNNDGDIFNLSQVAHIYQNLTLFDDYANLIIDNKKIFLIHDNLLGELATKSQEYDYVFCGHNHKAAKNVFGKSTYFNPGELSGHMYGRSTFGVWESDSGKFNLINLKTNWVDVKKYKHDGAFDYQHTEFSYEEL